MLWREKLQNPEARRAGDEKAEPRMLGPSSSWPGTAWGAPSAPEPQSPCRLVHIAQPSEFKSLCPGSWLREGKAGEGPKGYSLGWLEGPRGPVGRPAWQRGRYWGWEVTYGAGCVILGSPPALSEPPLAHLETEPRGGGITKAVEDERDRRPRGSDPSGSDPLQAA